MGNTEAIEVRQEDVALSLLGWQIEDARARLVTKSYGPREHYQEIAISATVRHVGDDWIDRFTSSSYVPPLLARLNCDHDNAPSRFKRLAWESLERARRGPIRVSATSDSWESKEPVSAADIMLSLTAYDIEDVNADFLLVRRKRKELPIDIVVETSINAISVDIGAVAAYKCKEGYDKKLNVHLEGGYRATSVQDLLAAYLSQNSWHDANATLAKVCPFEVSLPQICVEIVDDEGFLLERTELSLYGEFRVDENGKLPNRSPRFVADVSGDVDDMPGKPARVIVRISDRE